MPASEHRDPMRESLESALVDEPDDLANHMAYADYLTEQGDPLGDFVRVQLALEDQSIPADERKRLRRQERTLLKAHGGEWLGDLAPFLFDPKAAQNSSGCSPDVKFVFRRGWLDSLAISGYTVNLCRAMARSPALRLLRVLQLANDACEDVGEDYEPGDDVPADNYFPQLYALARGLHLGNVREFTLGQLPTRSEEANAEDEGMVCSTEGEAAVDVVRLMPKLESLYLLAHDVDSERLFALPLPELRELLLYHNDEFALDVLAGNRSLAKLTHLRFHPHALDAEHAYIRLPAVQALVNSPHLPALTHLQLRLSDMGDRGIEAIVASGLLARLKVLDLQHGRVSDEGARCLAACPQVQNLERIDLTNNALTKEGIKALKATGVKVVARNQWDMAECGEDYDQYLSAGDIE